MSSIEQVKAVVGDLPYMSLDQAEVMTRLIAEHDVRDVLELGFCHGVSTCYIAAALAKREGGHVVTIDRANRLLNTPTLEKLLERLSLRDRATIFYEYDSYNWRLHKFLTQSPAPEFDLIYLDGAHTWSADGFAFLLAERLLAPGGLIVFDDLYWSFASSNSAKTKTGAMPADERELPQVKMVFDTLVASHPNIAESWEEGSWGFAQKGGSTEPDAIARSSALEQIQLQAEEVRARAESAVASGEWAYGAWPGSLLPVLDSADRRKVTELGALVDKLKEQREELVETRDAQRRFIAKLKRDRAWLEHKLGLRPRPDTDQHD